MMITAIGNRWICVRVYYVAKANGTAAHRGYVTQCILDKKLRIDILGDIYGSQVGHVSMVK